MLEDIELILTKNVKLTFQENGLKSFYLFKKIEVWKGIQFQN